MPTGRSGFVSTGQPRWLGVALRFVRLTLGAAVCLSHTSVVFGGPATKAPAGSTLKVGDVVARSAPQRPAPIRPAQPAAAQASAQPPTPSAVATVFPPLGPFQLPLRVGISTDVVLTLSDALSAALDNNPDMKAFRVDAEASRFKVLGARGAYDPTFNVEALIQKATIPAANSLSGSTTGELVNKLWRGTATFGGLTPGLGGRYTLSFTSEKDRTTNAYALLDPSYPTSVSVEYSQPLWGQARYNAPRHAIEVARKHQDLSVQQFRRRVMETVRQVEQAYWELTFAWRNLDVQVEALGVAREQYEANRRQATAGQLAPIEVVAAQTQLAGFESNVYAAQDALTRAENALKLLMLPERTAPLWGASLRPITPTDTSEVTIDLAQAVSTALAARPELKETDVSVQINQADQHLNREQLKPQMELAGRYSLSGLAGQVVTATANPLADSLAPALARLNELSVLAAQPPVTLGTTTPPPSTLVGGYNQSLDRLWAGDFPTAMVALKLSLPIANRTAKANLGATLAEGRRLQLQRQALEQLIEAEIRNALQAVSSARERLKAAESRRRTSEQEYESEARRFSRGASTLFLVQQRQLSMVTATSLVRRAEADLSDAVSQFELARGENYRRHHITLNEDGDANQPTR